MAAEQRSAALPSIGGLAQRSCLSCKARKRRCTRELPACRLCVRGHRTCSYKSARSVGLHQNLLEAKHDAVESRVHLKNAFPVAFFLDTSLYNRCLTSTPIHCDLPLTRKVNDLLGDVESRKALVAEYFHNANRWLPIVSPIRIYGLLASPAHASDAGVAAVLLAMKLLVSCPQEAKVCSELYVLAKELHLHAEMAGSFTVHFLQSKILVALYEIGHAIYPSAFVTVSACARLAITQGITESLPIQGRSWLEQEERNRLWWAVLILDRSMNLGCEGRNTCMADPAAEAILPVNDNAWEQGVLLENHSLNLSSVPSSNDGRYARLVQAIKLLSQVFHSIGDEGLVSDEDAESVDQLERTLFALENLASFEEQESNICCLSAIATCLSAILLLRMARSARASKSREGSIKIQTKATIDEVLKKTLRMFERYREGWGSLQRFPPLALDWLYRAAVAQVSLTSRDDSNEGLERYAMLKEGLERASTRWAAAAHYLRLLDVRKTVWI